MEKIAVKLKSNQSRDQLNLKKPQYYIVLAARCVQYCQFSSNFNRWRFDFLIKIIENKVHKSKNQNLAARLALAALRLARNQC